MNVITTLHEPKTAFLLRLKQDTAPMHERLEQSNLSVQLLKEDVSQNDYTAYLKKMRGVIAFTEDKVFPAISFLFPDLEERKKLRLLDADLSFFGVAPSQLTELYRPFKTADIGFALGHFYVVEGSTLGGRMLLKHLQTRIPISADEGGTFFAGYKETTGSKWKNFLDTFSDYAIKNNCEEEIINGAKNAFETIYQHFES